MRVDDCGFGWIVIDGRRYERDLILAGGRVIADWWRKEGHNLGMGDLTAVLAAAPDVLVIGTGQAERMEVPPETRRALAEKGIALEVYDTATACQRFNQLAAAGQRVAAAFHLTC